MHTKSSVVLRTGNSSGTARLCFEFKLCPMTYKSGSKENNNLAYSSSR